MEFTNTFLRAKSPCADGFRWFVRNVEDGSGYQEALDTLVNAGRVEDACWLLAQFGPTSAVLRVDALDAEAVVFAGALEVRGGIDVGTVVQAGRSIRAGGGLRAGRAIVAGEDIRVAGSILSNGTLQAGGDVRADWGIEVQGAMLCGGHVRAAWDVLCHGKLSLTGSAFVGQDLIIHAGVECGKSLRAGGAIVGGADSIRAGQGILAGGTIRCGMHLEAGWGIRSGESIHANGAIKAGESLSAGNEIRAGVGYGVYAGLSVQVDAWNSSAQVHAASKPEGLRSGCWAGPRAV